MMNKRINIAILIILIAQVAFTQVRLKDMGRFAGTDAVRVIGYGLVVGLDRTGDSQKSLYTNQSLANMLERFGIAVDSETIRAKNVAAVVVTADIPPFMRIGGRFDVTVSSIGDAKSLQGGTLLQTILSDLSSEVWGVAAGPVAIGGFTVETEAMTIRQNHPVVGRITEGGSLERDMESNFQDQQSLTYSLRNGDFTTAQNAADAINMHFGTELASAVDAISLNIAIPPEYVSNSRLISFISEVENVRFVSDVAAKVVINEKTGTIIIGANAGLSSVAVSHGSLSITIKSQPLISQPPAFSGGQTTVEQLQEITVEQGGTDMVTMPDASTVGDVAKALNRLGVTPRDMIAIFQALKQAGALQAELVFI